VEVVATATVELRSGDVADARHFFEIFRSAELADGDPMVTTFEEVEEWFNAPGRDPAVDMRLALIDGRPVGFARVDFHPSGVGFERAYLWGAVTASQRGVGVGSALVAWAVDRARELLQAQPGSGPLSIRMECWDWCHQAHQLFVDHGFTAVRWASQMLRSLEELPAVTTPSGVRIVAWDPARSDELRQVKSTAFMDHWGSTPTSAESWEHETRGHGARPDLSQMAVADDGSIVGLALNEHYPDDEALFGRREGYFQAIGTLREWRGKGVASALIAASLHRFAEAGLTHAGLGVDRDNPTGAFGLYTALGFEPTFGSVTYQLEVER
jgi:mycothiol synthase